ncbi:MAG: hypothetical protein M3N95_10165 [Actinomycetota bacterium]|nr:hypothetical protein [Actinomycetota bacterium]
MQIAIVAVACTALERNIGARRTVLVALSGQVLATLLTEYGAEVGASLHLSATSPADRPDAGVSYVMFSLLAASLLLLKGTPRVLGISVIVAWASIMFVRSPGMTSAGHLLCIALGLATMRLIGGRVVGRRRSPVVGAVRRAKAIRSRASLDARTPLAVQVHNSAGLLRLGG